MDTIHVTDVARENILELRHEYGTPESGLRFGLTGGGCSGYKYVLEFEDGAQDDDLVFEFSVEDGAFKVFVHPDHMDKLKNSTIDWKESLMDAGFDIANPQAKRPCGCGESVDF